MEDVHSIMAAIKEGTNVLRRVMIGSQKMDGLGLEITKICESMSLASLFYTSILSPKQCPFYMWTRRLLLKLRLLVVPLKPQIRPHFRRAMGRNWRLAHVLMVFAMVAGHPYDSMCINDCLFSMEHINNVQILMQAKDCAAFVITPNLLVPSEKIEKRNTNNHQQPSANINNYQQTSTNITKHHYLN